MLKIKTIDTSEQAKKFANQIKESPKTYFLQGSWGSGKTQYLIKVKKELKKYTFIDLELWKPKDQSSLAKTLFSTVHYKLSILFTILGWLFLILSVVGSVILSIRGIVLVQDNQIRIPLLATTIAVILTTLYGFLQSKWLDIDRVLMNLSLRSLKSESKPKILVIDDFDRLDSELQMELYIVFNAIHEQTRIIFVGDFQKLKGVENHYLGKIIDQKISLPYSLHSRNIAQKIQDSVLAEIKEQCDCSVIKALFIDEGRTARDANQFLAYVDNELVKQKKVGKVQLDQQLFVIYLYLFHPIEYQLLLDGWLPEENKSSTNIKSNGDDANENSDTLVGMYMSSMFQPRKTNPTDFRENASVYFVDELANNYSIMELKDIIISDGEGLRKLFLISDSNSVNSKDYEELLDYISRMNEEEYRTVSRTLEKNAVTAMKSEVRHIPNQLVKNIFERRSSVIAGKIYRAESGMKESDSFEEMDHMFADVKEQLKVEIHPTEKMYYYRTCLNLFGVTSFDGGFMSRSIPMINDQNVMEHFKGIAETIERDTNFGNSDYDAEALIVQLGYSYWLDGPINPTQNPDFQSKIDSIEKLNQKEYRAFWENYRIKPIENEKGDLILQGGGIFEFSYKGKEYRKIILERLSNFK